ncbi:hypothetical protein EV356DRAFT_509699 [Viridothelium virens]|uniref:Rhodopsin domain-containing protein n=1 Tax=Viridothelium virens TaxID=1048519 RepID=A0A6A6HIM7_VIRVR|nr:hypothetical protein EV356DRAFT_509699 [Viridothelium virens]
MKPLLQALFAVAMLWSLAVTMVKISICAFYVRVFGRKSHTYITSYVVMIVSVAWCLVAVFGLAFECGPLEAFWDHISPGTICGTTELEYAIINGLNALNDLIILLLPLPAIWNLQISTQEKVQVSCIFLLGSLTCGISLARLIMIVENQADDPAWNAPQHILAVVEVCTGIVSACLPTMRPLAQRIFSSRASFRDISCGLGIYRG